MAKKDVNRRFTVTLDIDTKDAEKQVKATVGNLKTILTDLGKASDKVKFFKELVDYIGQVDRALEGLKAKDGKAFTNMFSGLDESLRKGLEGVFDTSKETMNIVDGLRDKINAAAKDKLGVTELRGIAEEINGLYATLGKAQPIDIATHFTGRGKRQDRIDILTNELNNFALVWQDVHFKVKSGFGFGGGTGGGLSDSIKGEVDSITSQIRELEKAKERFQNVYKEMSNVKAKGSASISDAFKIDITTENIQALIQEFDELSAKLEVGDKTSVDYYNNLMRMSEVILTLQRAKVDLELPDMKDVKDAFIKLPGDQYGNFLGKLSAYAGTLNKKFENQILKIDPNKLLTKEIEALYTQRNSVVGIETPPIGISEEDLELAKKLIELRSLSIKQFYAEDAASYDQLDKEIERLQKEINTIAKVKDIKTEVSALLTQIENSTVDDKNFLENIENMLNLDTNTLKGALGNVGARNFVLDKLLELQKANDEDSDEDESRDVDDIQDDILALGSASEKIQTEIQEIIDEFSYGEIELEDALEKIVNILSAEVPAAADKAKAALGEVGGAIGDGTTSTTRDDELPATQPDSISQEEPSSPREKPVPKGDKETFSEEEITDADKLIDKIKEIELAVNNKTAAFTNEATTVEGVVNQEIQSLSKLKEYLVSLKALVQEVFYGKQQKIGFHSGDLDYYAKTGKRSESLGISGSQLTDNYGAYGTGIYYVSDPNQFAGEGQDVSEWVNASNKLYAIDLSKYNLYAAQTTERAEQLYNFLSQLEKFVLASSGFKGFDDDLKNVNIESLFKDMKQVFGDIQFPQERLQKFVDDMKDFVVKFGIDDTGDIKNLGSILGNGDDITTQFMRLLGYQGIDVSGTKFDNGGRGSVVYDLDQSSPYVQSFDNINDVLEYHNKMLGQTGALQDSIGGSIGAWNSKIDEVYGKLRSISQEFHDIHDAIRSLGSDLGMLNGNKNISDEDLEIAKQEKGTLEEKLALLDDIAREYGADITQAKRNRLEELNQKDMNDGLTAKQEERYWELSEAIDEADKNLNEFAETYERITLKLANGKKIDILPDDAGLRKLDKIANEYLEQEYNGVEIEDVQFVRAAGQEISTEKQFAIKMDTADLESSIASVSDKIDSSAQQILDASKNLTNRLDSSFATLSDKFDSNAQQIIDSSKNLTNAVDNLTAVMQKPQAVDDPDTERNQQIEYMKQNLLKVFETVSEHNARMINGDYAQQETAAEFFADGSIALGYGEKGSVNWKTTIESILSNILNQSIMSMHSHPWKYYPMSTPGSTDPNKHLFANDAFSGSRGDLSAWKTLQKYGSQLGAMLTGNIIRTFDVGKIGDKYTQFLKNLRDIEMEYIESGTFAQYIGRDEDTGAMFLNRQSDLKGYHDVGDVFRGIMVDALERTGFSLQDIGGIYKEYNLTNDKELTSLATILVDLSTSAQAAADPVEALKNLLGTFGAANIKNDIIGIAKRIDKISKGFISGDSDFEYSQAKKQIRTYAGDVYDQELSNLDGLIQTGNASDLRKVADSLLKIASKFGADIESQEGLVALEAFRKGEMNIAEVWNNFGAMAKVSQEAIDNMRVIDSSKEDSAEIQTLSHISSTLDTISSTVSSIEANTQRTLQDQLDAGAQTLMAINEDSNLTRVIDPDKSLFTPDNVSEFKVQELFNVANDAMAKFLMLFNDVSRSSAYGDIEPAKTQSMYDAFVLAVNRINDAKLQLDAFQGRYGDDNLIASTTTGEALDSDKINYMFDVLNRAVADMGTFLVNAKQVVADATGNVIKTTVTGSDYQSKDDWDDDWKDADSSDLISHLSNLTIAIENLSSKLSGDIDSISSQIPIVEDKDLPTVDVSSELTQCNQLFEILAKIVAEVDRKTQAFIDEGSTVSVVIENEVAELMLMAEALEKIIDNVALIKNGFEQIGTGTLINDSVFEVWKNDLTVVKNNLDDILQSLQGINALTPNGGQGIDAEAGKVVDQSAGGYALDSTVLETNRLLGDIFGAINTDSELSNIVTALTSATETLQNVANGIIEHQKAQRTDLTDSSTRIAKDYGYLLNVAGTAVAGLGHEMQIDRMAALAHNIVRVSGAVKDASGVWKGFTVDIDESNKAVIRAIDEQSEFARSLNGTSQAAQNAGKTTKDPVSKTLTQRINDQRTAFNNYRDSLKEVHGISLKLRDELDALGIELASISDDASFESWKKDFQELKNEIVIANKVWKKGKQDVATQVRGAANKEINKLDFDIFDENLTSEQQTIRDLRDQLIKQLVEYEKRVEKGQDADLTAINATKNALYQEIEAYKERNNIVDARKKVPKAQMVRTATTKYTSLSDRASTDELKDSTIVQQKLTEYTASYQKLVDIQSKFKAGEVLTQDQEQEFSDAREACNKYARELEKLLNIYQKTMSTSSDHKLLNELFDNDNFEDTDEGRQTALKRYVDEMYGADATIVKFTDQFNKLIYTVDNGDGTFTQMTAVINNTRTAIDVMTGEAQEATGVLSRWFGDLKSKFKSISTYLVASFGWQEVWQQLRRGVTYVREIDSALTELKKVTDETDATYDAFLQTMSKTASAVGSTVKDLTSSAADWGRLGYSIEEAGRLAETTAKLLNVSEFTSVDEATSALVSSLQSFTTAGQDVGQRAEEIVDILNNIGNRYPVATNELADGLATSSAALVAANNSIEEQVALLSAGNATMQDISTVASGLKIVAARLRGTTTDIDEDADSAITNVSKLQSKIKALTKEANGGEGIDIINENGEYKSTYEILSEISKIFDKMDDMSAAGLLELIAGKNRSSVVAAILQNGNILEKAYADALDSESSAQRELDTYLDSIQGRVDLFTNSLQTMWMNFINDDFVKMIVDAGTALLQLIDKVGVLQSALLAFAGIKGFLAIKDFAKKWDESFLRGFIDILSIFKNDISIIFKQSQSFGEGIENMLNLFNLSDTAFGKYITNLLGVTATQAGATTSTLTFSAALGTLKTGLLNAGKSLISFLFSWKGLLVVAGIATVVGLAYTAINNSHKHLMDELKESSEEYAEEVSNLKSLQTELDTTREKIEELEAKGPLTLTEEEDLNRLRSENDELERQLQIQKRLAEHKRQEALKAFNEAFESDKSFQDFYIAYDENGYANGGINWSGYGENQGTSIDQAISNYNAAKQAEQDALQALHDTEAEVGTKEYNKLEKAYTNAQERVSAAETTLTNLQSDIQEYLDMEGVEWTADPTTVAAETANEYIQQLYNAFDQIEIARGTSGAKSDAIDRILIDQASESTKDFKEEIEKILEEDEAIFDVKLNLENAFNDLDEARKRLDEVKQEAESLGVNASKTVYGNIDTDNRARLEWTTENLEKYKRELSSWFDPNMAWEDIVSELEGSYATVFGSWDTFGEQQIPIAFSPMLQTSDGVKLLDETTVYDYIGYILDKATADGSWTIDEIIQLDAKGIDDVKGLIADVGETAEQTSEAMHFSGSTGAIADLTNYVTTLESNISELMSTIAAKIQDILNKYPMIKSALEGVGINTNDLAGYFLNIGEYAGSATNQMTAFTTSMDTLTASVDAYKNALDIVNKVAFDRQSLSQEYFDVLKEQLKDITVGEEGFTDAVDENNDLVVKNAALLRKLVVQKKQEQKANVRTAKSMSQLQYKNTVQQLQQVVKAMALEVKASGLVSKGTLNTIDILRNQLTALKQTIQQYALLELQLSDAANAYTEFESAKERDTQLTYGDSMIEALQTLNEGFKTGQVGTEAFEFAARIIVPEEILGIEDIEKRMIAIHDYVDKNPLFADWFTIDEGEFSIALDNINNFIDDAHKAGLFTNDSSGDFFLTDAILSADEPLKEFAQVLGEAFNTEVTEGSVLAMLTELEKYDASWGNIISDLMTNPLDREINKATDALNEAITAQEEFIRNGGSLESEKYKELTTNVESAQKALEQSMFAVEQNTQKYIELETVYSALTGKITLTKDAADQLFKTLGFVDENGNVTVQVDDDGTIHITDEQLKVLQQKADELEAEPTIMDVQLKYDTIDAQISELQKYIDEDLDFKDSTIAVTLGITNEDEAKAKIAELTALQQTISLNYNITTTSTEQDAGALEKLTTWESEGLRFDIIANTQKLQEAVQEANALEVEDKEPKIIVQGVPVAVSAIETVKDALDSLADETVNITTNKTTYEQTKRWNSKTQSWETMLDGTAHVNGTAYAGGNWGAPKTEVALTGELGPEMLVRDGRWQLIGENGAEFTQIKKNDIIFNHKQTEDLLSKGYVTGRGKAYAGGTTPHTTSGPAYYRTFGGYVGDEDVFKNGSDNWMDPWTNTADSLSDAADSISDAADEFNEVFDWIEVRLEEIEEKLGLFGAALENAVSYLDKNSIIDKMIDTNKVKLENLNAGYQKYSDYAAELLTKIPEKYREAAQNGAIAIEEFVGEADETTLEAIQNYREWAQKAADVKQQSEETITEIRDLAIQAISNIYDAQSIRVDVENSQTEKLQNAVDYWETKGEIPSALYYGTNGGNAASSTGMFENSYKEIEYWSKALAGMQAELNEAVQKGQIEVGSIEWYEQIDQLYQVQSEIDQAKTEIEEFQNSINDLYWDNFDELISRLEYTENDTQNLIDVMSEADKVVKPEGKTLKGGTVKFWTVDEVEWTKEGMASMGLYAQQMEIAEAKTKQYAKAIDDLTADYEAGLYSENEYLEKLNELKDGQYDAIESYQDAKDAIVDLNKERIDAVKEGINLEIEALEELISKRKEELSAEKDLHDFQKSIMQQEQDIAATRRKLAALASDNSASAVAQRKKLQAELAEQEAALQDSYYDRSVENQQTALDKTLEDFKTEKEAELTALDEYLTNVETVVAESLGIVQANAEQIGQTLTEKAEEYNLTVSDAVMLPWKDGMLAISDYTTRFGDSMSSTTDQLDLLKTKWQEVIDKMNEAAAADIAAKEQENKNYTAATKKESVVEEKPKEEPKTETQQQKTITVGGKINAKGAKIYTSAGSSKGLNQYYGDDPIYTVLETKGNWLKVRYHKLKSGVTGWFKKGSVQAYAKGTTGVKSDQLAWIDEMGLEELVMHAGPNGRLEYLTKGSAVIPHDITENLLKLGTLDPQEVLNRSRPQITMPHVVNNEINISMDIAEVVHIDTVTNDTIPDLTKAIQKQMDSYMSKLNNAIKAKVR